MLLKCCMFFSFIFISWRLITLQYCSGFCHTLIWISHGFICLPHPEPPSHLPRHPIPLGHPSAPAPSPCVMHQTRTGDLKQIIYFNWRIIALQYRASPCHTSIWIGHRHTCDLPSWNPLQPPLSIPPGGHRAPALDFLYHTWNFQWLSILVS